MKILFIIVLVNVVLAILFTLGIMINGESFTNTFVSVCLGGGALNVVVGLFLLILKDKRYAQGFLISGGVLLLLGFVTCSAAAGM